MSILREALNSLKEATNENFKKEKGVFKKLVDEEGFDFIDDHYEELEDLAKQFKDAKDVISCLTDDALKDIKETSNYLYDTYQESIKDGTIEDKYKGDPLTWDRKTFNGFMNDYFDAGLGLSEVFLDLDNGEEIVTAMNFKNYFFGDKGEFGDTIFEAFKEHFGKKEESLKEATNETDLDKVKKIAVGKKVNYKDKEYTINDVFIYDNNYYFNLSDKEGEKVGISGLTFKKGIASTTDPELAKLVDVEGDSMVATQQAKEKEKADKEAETKAYYADQEQKEKQHWDKEIEKIKDKVKKDIENKDRVLYDLFTRKKYSDKAQQYPKEYRDKYITAYENEKANKKKNKMTSVRVTNALAEYPGDLDELLKWMRENITSIEVGSPIPDREQQPVDIVNERDGTDYQVKKVEGLFPSYIATFKNGKTAPQDFIDWQVYKQSPDTADTEVKILAPAFNPKTGKLTSNDIVRDMVYNPAYKFHLGKY